MTVLGLESETDADDFERIGKENGADSGNGAADESADGCLVFRTADDDGPNLLIRQEFDAGIREDP